MFSFISKLVGTIIGTTPSTDEVINAPYGFQVLDVIEKSPAAEAGLVCFFDYIIAANENKDIIENYKLKEIIEENINNKVTLTVYNSKNRHTRDVEVIPRNDWGGDSLLGTQIRYDKHRCSEECMINVLSVAADSPAAQAELQQYYDYILGTPEEEFESPDYFQTILADNIGKQIPLYVYNIHTDEILLTPSYTWGGKGCAGLQIGSGYLHQIPEKNRETTGSNCYSNPYLHLLSSNMPQYSLLKKTKSLKINGRTTLQSNLEDKPIQQQQQETQQEQKQEQEQQTQEIQPEIQQQQTQAETQQTQEQQQQQQQQQQQTQAETQEQEQPEIQQETQQEEIHQEQQLEEEENQPEIEQQQEENDNNNESHPNNFNPINTPPIQALPIPEIENIPENQPVEFPTEEKYITEEGKEDENQQDNEKQEKKEDSINDNEEEGWGDDTPLDIEDNIKSSE